MGRQASRRARRRRRRPRPPFLRPADLVEIIVRRLPGPFGWQIVGGTGIPDDAYFLEDGDQAYLLAEIAEAFDPDRPALEWVALYRWTRPPATGLLADRDDDSRRYWGG